MQSCTPPNKITKLVTAVTLFYVTVPATDNYVRNSTQNSKVSDLLYFFLRVIITCHYFYHTFFVTILGSGLGNIMGTSGPSETSVHHAARPRHLLSLKKLRELKENATKILKSYDGQCLELQQFKKVYKDTFGKRLKPKTIEEAMPLLDDVFVLEQSGKEVTIKLKDQAEKRSDSPQSVSGNLLGES